MADQAQPFEPRHSGPGGVDLPVQAVGGRAPDAPGHARGEPVGRARCLWPRGREQERAGAVGALRLARLEAGFGEERGLLIDGQARHGQRAPERRGVADGRGAVDDLGLLVGVELEQRARLGGPCGGVEVEQQRPRGGRRVGDAAACELEVQPRVDRRDHPAGARPATQPRHLRRREVRVQRQAGQGLQPLGVRGELARDRDGAAVLPTDRRPERAARGGIPAQHRLALVGDPDGAHRGAGVQQRAAARGQHRVQELLRVLLHRAARAPYGRDRDRAFPQHRSVVRDDDGLRAGGALVDREDVHRVASAAVSRACGQGWRCGPRRSTARRRP